MSLIDKLQRCRVPRIEESVPPASTTPVEASRSVCAPPIDVAARPFAAAWSDLARMCDRRAPTLPMILAKLLLHPRFRAVLMFRIAHTLHGRRTTRPLAGWLTGRILRGCGAELAAGARIGVGLALRHTGGLVVGTDVVAGQNLTLHQGVTLGDRVPGAGQPVLGDRVFVGAGASVLGPVTIGDDVVVAAGAVVLSNVPGGAVVAGVPARVIRTGR